jgi:hypothetical protein
MILGVRAARRAASGGGDGDADAEEEATFVPSPLDWSVRAAHGGSSTERAREPADVSEQARDLESQLLTSVAFYRSDRPQSGGRYGNCLHESL